MTKVDSFIQSVTIGDLTAVQRIIGERTKEKEPNALLALHDSKGRTGLHISATLDKTDILKQLLSIGGNPNVQDYDRRTPIFYAIQSKRIETVQLLINEHALIEAEDYKGYTPILVAADSNSEEILELLCEEGVDINHVANDGISAVAIAARRGWADGVEMLIKYGAKIDKQPGSTPILLPLFTRAMKKGLWEDEDVIRTIQCLVEKGAEMNTVLQLSKDKDAITPLQIAIQFGNVPLYDALSKGVPKIVKLPLPNGKLPLEFAVEKGNLEIIDKLVAAGADIKHIFPDNSIYLHIAAKTGNKEVFDYFLNKYLVDAPNYLETARREKEYVEDKKNEIRESRKKDSKRGKEILVVQRPVSDRYDVPRKIDHFWIDNKGTTVLMKAAQAGAMDIVEELIRLGLDPSVENKKHQTAYTLMSTAELAEKMTEIALEEENQDNFELLKLIEPYHAKCDLSRKQKDDMKMTAKDKIKAEKEKKSEKPKKKNSTLSVATMAAQFDEKNNQVPKQSPIARPWGGSIEAEEFRRNTRKELRKLRQEVMDKTQELKNKIKELCEEYEINLDNEQ